MIRLSRRSGWWLIALAVLAIAAGLRAPGALQSIDNAFADQRARPASSTATGDCPTNST